MNKSDLRKAFIKKRNALTQETVGQWSESIRNRILKLVEEKQFQVIAAYADFRNEPKTMELLSDLLSMGKTVALPKCGKNGQMTMFRVTELESLEKGAYGILEPPEDEAISPEKLDLVLCPGCAFSLRMERLGYGGGYYDRYLPLCKSAVKLGVCYELSLTEVLPTEQFDVRMDGLVTEKRLVNKL